MAPSPPPGRGSRIVVVDDERDGREILDLLLGGEGHEVRTADTGESALAMIERDPPDAILLDLHMPGMSGFAALERLKQDPRLASIPVIVVSASAQESDVVRALERGATDYVSKPYAVEILLARVRAVLRSKREKEAIWRLGEELRHAEEELARTRRHAAIGAIAAGLAHEINNPAAFVVTDLHEVRELARELAEVGDAEHADALAALADEALDGMNRIRDVVKDLAVFASVADRRSAPSPQAIDVAAIVRARAERLAGSASFVVTEPEPAWVAQGLAGEDELDALIGLLLRHSSPPPGTVTHVAIERGESVVVRVTKPKDAGEDPLGEFGLGVIIARELAERFGGKLAHTSEGWELTLPRAPG